jgi:hypothetical protein
MATSKKENRLQGHRRGADIYYPSIGQVCPFFPPRTVCHLVSRPMIDLRMCTTLQKLRSTMFRGVIETRTPFLKIVTVLLFSVMLIVAVVIFVSPGCCVAALHPDTNATLMPKTKPASLLALGRAQNWLLCKICVVFRKGQ